MAASPPAGISTEQSISAHDEAGVLLVALVILVLEETQLFFFYTIQRGLG